MRKFLIYPILLIFCSIGCKNSTAPTSNNNNNNGSPTPPKGLFAGTTVALYHSADSGKTWTSVLTNYGNILSLDATASDLFVGAYNGVVVSTDNGATWANNPQSPSICYALLNSGGFLFAGTDGLGVRRTSDNGSSWNAASTGLTQTLVKSLATNGTTILAGTGSAGIFRSSDNGDHWTTSQQSFVAGNALLWTGTHFLAATENGVFASTDNGTSWHPTSITSPTDRLGMQGGTIFANTFDGNLVQSMDDGATWNDTLHTNFQTNIAAIATTTNDIYIGSLGDGISRSTDHGATWKSLNANLPDLDVYTLLMR